MINIIQGSIAKDQRGQIRFVNDFDMNLIKRFYIIKNADTNLIRGWRAHKIEQRWFYILSGAFEVSLIKIDHWEHPSRDLPVEKKIFSVEGFEILHVPKGYATALRASIPNSEILVFADHDIDHAVKDDYTWGVDYFKNF